MTRTVVTGCPAPEQPHDPGCDVLIHTMLIAAVFDAIDPPLYRAVVGDHTLCVVYPCADCQWRAAR